MSIIKFNDSMAVNIRAIDDQHKQLINMINELASAMKSGSGKDVLNDMLVDLAAYADYHFKTEEELFKQYNYPNTDKHVEEHKSFRDHVEKFNDRYQQKKNLGITVEILNFLTDWLSNHIKKTDKEYSKFFNNLGIY
jgi:hemerythrin-like metal-binding protein